MTEETERRKTYSGHSRNRSIWHHRGKRSIIVIEQDLFKHGSLAFVGFKIIKQGAQITCGSIYITFNFRLTHLHVAPSKRSVCGRCRLPQTEWELIWLFWWKKPQNPNLKTLVTNQHSRIFTSAPVTPTDQQNTTHALSCSHLDGEWILTPTSLQGHIQHLIPLKRVLMAHN